jgi:hypothetical protein
MSIFDILGGRGREPRTQQVVQSSKLPEEISPFAKDILEAAQKLYEKQMAEGYQQYPGQTIAPMTPEQIQSQEGLKALVGTQRPMQEEALAQYRTGITEKFTPEVAQEYMSPYQRAVIDTEKREAQRAFESQVMPQFEKQAVQAGGMSGLGTRAGVQAAELGRAQMQRLGDIETRGLQAAYQDAQNLYNQQQMRERQAAADIAGLAPAMVAGGITEQGLLKSIGEEKQALGQEALNEAYFRYLEEQAFPQEQLAGYSGFVYGNPLMQQRTMTTTSPMARGPSRGQQLLGLGLTAGKIYGMGGGAGFGGPGWTPTQFAKGMGWTQQPQQRTAQTGGGIASLPVVYRQQSNRVKTPIFGPDEQARVKGYPSETELETDFSEDDFSKIVPEHSQAQKVQKQLATSPPIPQIKSRQPKEIGTESIRDLYGRERAEIKKQVPGISWEDLYSGLMEGDPDDPLWVNAMNALQKGFRGKAKLTKEQQKKLEALSKRETEAESEQEKAIAVAKAKAKATSTGKAWNAAYESIQKSIANKFNYIVDPETGDIKPPGSDKWLSSDAPGFKQYTKEVELGQKLFRQFLQSTGSASHEAQLWAVSRALEALPHAMAVERNKPIPLPTDKSKLEDTRIYIKGNKKFRWDAKAAGGKGQLFPVAESS